MSQSENSPLLVIDVQPAYRSAFGKFLPGQVLAEMRNLSDSVPIVVVSVNEELSGDTQESILDFWQRAGMDEALLQRVTFLEKPYGFFRSWMEQGVYQVEIVAVAKEMRNLQKFDVQELNVERLISIAPSSEEVYQNSLWLPHELEKERALFSSSPQ
jgi:hypothetical protein